MIIIIIVVVVIIIISIIIIILILILIIIIYSIPVVPARGGAEVALKIYIYIYKTFLIYRTCMRRAPAKPVRACSLRNWCLVSHVTFEAPLHTSHLTVFTLHTTHFTLHSSHCTLLIAFYHTPHFTLHTPHFTLHSSRPTLHTPYFISSELLSPYPSSSHFICHLSSHESLSSTTTKELACAVRQPGRCVRALCEAVAMLLSKNMTCARPRCNATWSKHFPHTSHCTLHTSHLSSFHLVSCLPICQLRSSWLFSCHLSAAQTFSCVGPRASARQQGWA